MMARTFGRQRRGGVPAFDPLGPGRVGADRSAGGGLTPVRTGRIAVAQGGDHPLQRIQQSPVPGGRPDAPAAARTPRWSVASSRGLRLISSAWLTTPGHRRSCLCVAR